LERRPDIEYSLNELKTLTAIYRAIAKTISAAVEEVAKKAKLINFPTL